MIIQIVLIVLGFVLLIKGADFLVDGSSNIAKKFHIPEIVIGLTIVSIGTSMPELFVSTTSALQGLSDMSLGNVIGSNICNLLLILGASAIISPVKVQKQTHLVEIPMCFAFTVIFMVLCNIGNDVSKLDAVFLLVLFIGFIGYTLYIAKKGVSEEENANEDTGSIIKNILLIVIGIIGLKIGGDLTVDNSVLIAQELGLSEKVIGLTILAVGTSLPELVTSVMAALKGNDDIAIGNIIGSNIFNMLMIIGVSAIIAPITYNTTYNVQLIILMISLIVLFIFPILPPKDKMTRSHGVIYLIMYFAYLIMLFVI